MQALNNKLILQDNGNNGYAGKRNFFQPRLTINQPGDVYEQEADATADKVMRMSDKSMEQRFFKPATPGIRRKCQHCEEEEKEVKRKEVNNETAIPSAQTENYIGSLNGKGRSLTPGERGFFEPRFGYDFNAVQLHTDSEANQSAKNINALAYTQGNNIVFGAGQYQPGTVDGSKLMAHELTHVVQQSANTQMPLQRKPAPKNVVPVYRQEAIDLLARAQKGIITIVRSQIIPDELAIVEKYDAFTEALSVDDVSSLPGLLDDFLKMDTSKFPLAYPTRDSMGEIIGKLLVLGLEKEAGKLERFFPALQKSQGDVSKGFNLKMYLWETITEKMPDAFSIKDPVAGVAATDAWLAYFKQLANEISSLDKDEIEKARTAKKNEPIDYSGYGGLGLADFGILSYLSTLTQNLLKAFTQFQVAYQVILDKAIDDLGKGKGDTFLKMAKARVDALGALKLPEEILTKEVEITKTVFDKKGDKYVGGKHVDYFMEEKEAKKHSETIDFYDPDPSMLQPDEKSLELKRIHAMRDKQITALQQLYGFETGKQGVITPEAKENADAIKKSGGLKLHSDEDWRKFLLEKYTEHKKATGDKVGAFDAVIDTIRLYMNAFTFHTPYNIEDFKDNQLTLSFPRALTGQLIHDCGVYALRIVYMLSLLKDHPDLNLTIRFIRLPVHAGLIITGNGLPTYFTHNDQLIRYKEAVMTDTRAAWEDTSATEGIPIPPGKKGDEQFLGEISASEFIPGVDIPFRIQEAPGLTGKRDKDVKLLWQFYKDKVVPDVFSKSVLDPKSKNYRFHLLYLDALESFKKYYNNVYSVFWNEFVVKSWAGQKKPLQDADAEIKKAAPGADHDAAVKKFDTLFAVYKKPIVDIFPKVDAAFQPIRQKLDAINLFLMNNPDVVAKGASLGNSFRIFEMDNERDWIFIQRDNALDTEVTKPGDRREVVAQPLD